MRILLVKMSSMGDIFHTFPAISDLKAQFPQAEIHWVVEAGFAEIATWHPAIDKVIPIDLRRWMKERRLSSWREFRHWRAELQHEQYDYIVDAQGLLKSALIAKCARGSGIFGYDKSSSREPISHWFYSRDFQVAKDQHAVQRTRQLLAGIFNYTIGDQLNFGVKQYFSHVQKESNKLIFIIGTSWTTKLWSKNHWIELAKIAVAQGFSLEIIWGSDEELTLAQEIIAQCPQANRPSERMSITAVAEKLVAAAGVVGLDTGFSHLAGALETPTIALYGPTSPSKVGLIGNHTLNLHLNPPLECMPCHKRSCKWLPEGSKDTPSCMQKISVNELWRALNEKINRSNQNAH